MRRTATMRACCAPCEISRFGCGAQGCARLGGTLPVVGSRTLGGLGHWQGDVDDQKRSLDPSMRATDAAFRGCPAMTPAERDAWAGFFAAWSEFRDKKSALLFGVGNEYRQALEFRAKLAGWQAEFGSKCRVPGPSVIGPEGFAESDTASISSAIKWGSTALIAIAIVWGVRTVVK